jgi:hypothetical protein
MKLTSLAIAVLCFALALPLCAQQREFLTDGEIDAIREAQEPVKRLQLYVQFAKQRVDTVAKLFQSTEANRGRQIHDALYEYDRILDAIDKNVDQAQQNRDVLRKGLEAALEQEPGFLKQLETVRAANPADLEEYRFALDNAIGNTRDSIDGLAGVLKKQPAIRKEQKAAQAEKKQPAPASKAGAAAPADSKPPAAGTVPPPDQRPGWDPNAGPPKKKK